MGYGRQKSLLHHCWPQAPNFPALPLDPGEPKGAILETAKQRLLLGDIVPQTKPPTKFQSSANHCLSFSIAKIFDFYMNLSLLLNQVYLKCWLQICTKKGFNQPKSFSFLGTLPQTPIKFSIQPNLIISLHQIFKIVSSMLTIDYVYVCSGSVVVTAYDFESGRPGSNPEWGLIYY